MADWNSKLYLKFSNERTQPSIDLVNRIELENPKKILDIGCGPGNSTFVLSQRYHTSYILGIDNSQNMIEKAKADYPLLDFKLCDANGDLSEVGSDYDIIFSNACIQWLPNHEELIKKLVKLLRKGGILAVQTPMNYNEPIHKIITETSLSLRWKKHFDQVRTFYNLKQEEYFDLLAELTPKFTLWETIYMHTLNSHQDILEWYRSTGMKPYLDLLSDENKLLFEQEILEQLIKAYPLQKNGKVIFRFPRFFFMAQA